VKALVLGGAGFIGSHVAEQLLARGHEVSVFARPNVDRRNLAAVASRLRFIAGDFLNAEDVRKAVRGADVVVHLVGSTLPGTSLLNPVYDLQTNVAASVGLLEACVDAQVRRIVYVSSGGTVYGIPRQDFIAEDHPLDPINPYGLSKLAVEKYCGVFRHQFGLDSAILRLSNPYGRRQREGSGQGVVGAWMARMRRGEPIELWGDGSVVRDYLAVEDAAKAIVLAAEAPTLPAVLNVGSGEGTSLSELLTRVEACAGRAADVVRRDARRVDVPRNVLDVALAARSLAWRAEIPLEQGLRAMWEAMA
jgi:UDP-glucose 4-epimerase